MFLVAQAHSRTSHHTHGRSYIGLPALVVAGRLNTVHNAAVRLIFVFVKGGCAYTIDIRAGWHSLFFRTACRPFGLLRSGVGNDALARIDQTLLVTAFTTGEDQYILPYSTAFGIDCDTGSKHFLLVRVAARLDKSDLVYEFASLTMCAGAASLLTVSSNCIPPAGIYECPHPLN